MKITIWTRLNNVKYINEGTCEYQWFIKNPTQADAVQLEIDYDTFFNLLDNFEHYLVLF